MKILALRSVPLSQETRNAWNEAGVRFAKRDRSVAELNSITVRGRYDAVLNLGNMAVDTLDIEAEVWNETDTIRSVSRPERLREVLDEFLPARVLDGPHWHKFGGYGGRGVRLCGTPCNDGRGGGDIQQHIDGVEYRVLTVGNTVVQAMRKENVRWDNGRHSFDWSWVGVDGIRNNGIIPHIKRAVENIPIYARSVLGWDIIVGDGGVYTLEINTSPGVNTNTAERIVRAMQ